LYAEKLFSKGVILQYWNEMSYGAFVYMVTITAIWDLLYVLFEEKI